jgi:hypothetical protein
MYDRWLASRPAAFELMHALSKKGASHIPDMPDPYKTGNSVVYKVGAGPC